MFFRTWEILKQLKKMPNTPISHEFPFNCNTRPLAIKSPYQNPKAPIQSENFVNKCFSTKQPSQKSCTQSLASRYVSLHLTKYKM